ncbi:MAG TPA: hypothetical protein VFU63_11085, partial [Ktedonobacterales bacterium]|nr:hypothetical protein [Ktedonobacterales bacterium]
MAKQHPSGALPRSGRGQRLRVRLTDSYGLVLLLLLLDYLAISSIGAYLWGNAVIILLLGFTLLFALRTSLSRRIWQLMALIFLVAGMVSAIVAAIMPGILPVEPIATLSAGVLLIATPFVILRRIIKHQIVTVETILGAVSVYLLLGFSFASIYALISLFAPSPFFADYPHTA